MLLGILAYYNEIVSRAEVAPCHINFLLDSRFGNACALSLTEEEVQEQLAEMILGPAGDDPWGNRTRVEEWEALEKEAVCVPDTLPCFQC